MRNALKLVSAKWASLRNKGIFHTLAALVAAQGLAFALRILLGRWLSLPEFGRISLIIESVNVTASLLTLGFPAAMMWFGVKENRLDVHLAGSMRVLGVYTLVALAAYALYRQWAGVFDDAVAARLLDVFVVFAPLFAVFNYVASYLVADKRGRERAALILTQRLSFVGLVIAGTYLYGFGGTVIGYLAFLVLFHGYLLLRYRKAIFLPICNYAYGQFLKFSGWDSLGLIPSAAAPFLLLTLSERLLDDVGMISPLAMAVSFSVLAKFAFAAILDNMFPYFMEKPNFPAFRLLLGKVLLLYVAMAATVLLVAYTLIPPIIELLLGARFQASIPLFKIVIVGEVVLSFSLLFESIHQMFRRLIYKAFAVGAALGAFTLALLMLVPAYGITGAAYAFLVFVLARMALMGGGMIAILSRSGSFDVIHAA